MTHITRRAMLQRMSAAGAVFGLNGFGNAEGESRPPNIIFILADDLGYGDLGCYGQKDVPTPNIDALAAEGMRFTDAYSGSTVCAPSRCCLMTGMHTGHAHIRGNKDVPLLPEDRTVAEHLRENGYATALVGKWGLGNQNTTGTPNKQGFDEFFGYLDQGLAHNYYPEYLWRNETEERIEGNVCPAYNVASERKQYSHDLFTREAIDFVRRKKEAPFFLYLAYTIPHPNNENRADGMEVPTDAPYSDRDWPQPLKNRAAMIARMDADIGRLMALLGELGIDKDTVVFFASDNGPNKEGGSVPEFFKSAGPLRGIKRDLYEGGIRVPLIARWPGRIAPGTVSNQPCAFWDFFPTAAELAHAPEPAGIDGISIAPTLLGAPEQQRQHDCFYWEFHEGGFKQAVRMGHYKAVRPKTNALIEIYDLETDLGERHDLAGEKPDLVAKVEGLFQSERTFSEFWGPKKP